MSTSWLNYDSNVDDEQDDNQRALAKIMSPVPAAQLVSPMQGVSNPPNGGVVNAISPSADYAQSSARPAAEQPQSAYQPQVANGQNYSIAPWNPDPSASLRPGGTNPQGQSGALTAAMSSMPNPQANVTGPMQPAQPAGQLQPASGKGGFWRGLGRVADVAGSIIDPALTARIPGSMLYNQHQVGIQQARAKAQADIADVNSQAAERTAQGQRATAQAGANVPRAVTADEAIAAGNPALEGSMMRPGDIGKIAVQGVKNTGQMDRQDDADSYQAKNAQTLADVRKTQQDLNDAKAELARAGNDPSSPQYQLALRKAQTAASNASAANVRAKAYWGNYIQGAYNRGLDGQLLPGTPQIADESGNLTGVGTKNAAQAIKSQANVAQFNDVYSALDKLDGSAEALVKAHGKGALSDPIVAAGLAEPESTFQKWAQGQIANGKMTAAQRDYVIDNRSAHERIQGMRKSAGGTSTDSSVAKLDALIPGASTPDLDYFKRQTKQIRDTADVLGTGVPTAVGGGRLRPAGGASPKPSVNHEVWVRGKDGKLVKQ